MPVIVEAVCDHCGRRQAVSGRTLNGVPAGWFAQLLTEPSATLCSVACMAAWHDGDRAGAT